MLQWSRKEVKALMEGNEGELQMQRDNRDKVSRALSRVERTNEEVKENMPSHKDKTAIVHQSITLPNLP